MKLQVTIERANEIAESLHGLSAPFDDRTRTALACFAISQQHYNSILLLLSNQQPLEATAFALLRPLTESMIRGTWILYCATDDQVDTFTTEGTKLDMASMMKQVGSAISKDLHGTIYQHWHSLSAYTHTGEHQVQRWLTTKDIEPKYSEKEIEELLRIVTGIMELTHVLCLSLQKQSP